MWSSGIATHSILYTQVDRGNDGEASTKVFIDGSEVAQAMAKKLIEDLASMRMSDSDSPSWRSSSSRSRDDRSWGSSRRSPERSLEKRSVSYIILM